MACLPSTDLYFTHALGHHLSRWWRKAPITRLGANCFAVDAWLVLIRADRPEIMRMALAWPGPVAYLIDDDIAGATASPGLPADYRRRLARFDAAFHRPLLARAQALLVPSRPLASRLAANPAITAPIHHIEPCWHLPPADQSHFAALAHGAPLRIAHLGTASHTGALAALAPPLAELLARQPNVHFTYVAPTPLAEFSGPNIHHLRPRRWSRYRRWLGQQRFHLALYPLAPEPFDRARSAAKLTEHAITGAVGLYPENWPPARRLGNGALFAPANPAEWAEALAHAIARRNHLAPLAAQAAAALLRQAPLARQQALWSNILGQSLA